MWPIRRPPCPVELGTECEATSVIPASICSLVSNPSVVSLLGIAFMVLLFVSLKPDFCHVICGFWACCAHAPTQSI